MSRKFVKQYANGLGIIEDPVLGITFDTGTSVPADGAVGYAPGCLFLDIDAAGGAGFYTNRGTRASANFDASPDLGALTATAAEINARCAAASRLINVTDAATYTVLAADSGKTHIIPDLTANCTLTLPAISAGLEYLFIGKAVAADAQNWIFQSASGVSFLGGLSFLDNDAGAGADEVHAGVYPNGTSNDFMTIVTPAAGTKIYLICDGTNWIASGIVISATIPTFSDT